LTTVVAAVVVLQIRDFGGVVAFGDGKEALRDAYDSLLGVWETIAWPGCLFDKLMDPMVDGAFVSPDLVGGKSTQLVGAINDLRQQFSSVARANSDGSQSNYDSCPAEA